MLKQFVSPCIGVFAFLVAVVHSAQATDLKQILIAKGAALVQTNANAPGLASTPFEFQCQVELSSAGAASGISVKAPTHSNSELLENLDSYFALHLGFTNKAKLDLAYPAGNYTLSTQGIHDGAQATQIFLGPDAYPTDPRVLNWAELQAVHAESNLFLSWMPYTGGTAQDFIQVRIYNDLGDFFNTPDYGQPGALNGTNTWVTVPAGTLFPGESYKTEILFGNILTSGPGTYPGAVMVTGYYKTTTTTLQTYNAYGALEFTARNYNVYEYEGHATVTVTRRGGTEGEVYVSYTTANGSAIGGDAPGIGIDYGTVFGTLTFGPGERTKSFEVPIFDDNTGDPTKVLQLFLFGFDGGATPGLITDATLTILDDEAAVGPNVGFYLVAKGQRYLQSSTNSPALSGDGPPYRFVAALEASFSNGVYNGSLTTPANIIRTLEGSPDGLQFNFQDSFQLKSGLDAAYPSGNYKFTITTYNQGLKTPILNLPLEAYPATPRFANWIEAQEIEPATEFVIRWDPVAGGTTNDLIVISIRNVEGNEVVSSPWLFEPGYLNGLATNWAIPANALQAGVAYKANLLFLKRASLNVSAYAGVPGLSGFYKETSASIAAAATPTPQGRLVFASTGFSVAESAGQAVITLNRVGGSSGPVTVDYTTHDGSAVAPRDYTPASATLAFADGEATKTFVVGVNDNFLLNGNRTLLLALSNPTGGAVIPNYPYATLTIMENENAAAGTVQFASTNIVVPESIGKASVVLTRTGGSSGIVTVGLFVGGGTASPGVDFVDPTATITFNPGETTKTVLVPIINDSLDEPNETLELYLSNTTGGASLGANRTTKLTITDNDAGGTIQFSTRAISVNETSPVVNLTVTRVLGGASGVTVNYAAFNGTAVNEQDFNLVAGTLTFGSNELSKVITFPLLNDALAEGNETFTVSLSNPFGGAILGANSNIVVTIVDDESSIQFSSATYTNSEGLLRVNITVQRLGPTATPASVDYFTMDDTASNLDYQAKAGHLSFGPGLTSQTISLVLSNDTIVEGQESFQVCLTNVVGALFGPRTNATVYINDNDLGGAIQFSATNYTIAESLANATVTISRSGGAASAVTVDFTTLDGTAIDGQDYVNSTRTIMFNANEVTKTVLIPIRNNALDEPNKTVNLRLSNVQGGATLGKNTSAILNIVDNDVGGTIQFSAISRAVSVSESNTVVQLSVTRAGGLAGGVTVDYVAINGTGTNELDFNLPGGTLYFGSNEVTKTITVPILDNYSDQSNKTFTVRLANPVGGAVLGPLTNSLITIVDDDVLVEGTFTGTGAASVVGCLDPAENGSASITWQFTFSAQEGHQFTATALGILTGTGSGYINVALSGTVDSSGNLKGQYSRDGGAGGSAGAGAFTGRLNGNSLQVSFSGSRPGETCKETSSMAGARVDSVQGGFAPSNLRNATFTCGVTGGSGYFAHSGSFMFEADSTGNSYQITGLTSANASSSGVCVYHKSGPNSGILANYDIILGVSSIQTISYSSGTTGTYKTAGSLGSGIQTGTCASGL
ncbi:MAG: hypothetical protein JWM16_3265 [Verrucomicrobiales bacterium]|nr:hypothetical protein [Verrucomicrobiales bacterium]